jgi:transcriptional regulator with XRE-family HTH domain
MRTVQEGPFYCIAEHPTSSSPILCGARISLTKIGHKTGVNIGYLSRIFSGQSKGSARVLRLIAEALGMSMEDLIDAISEKNRHRNAA